MMQVGLHRSPCCGYLSFIMCTGRAICTAAGLWSSWCAGDTMQLSCGPLHMDTFVLLVSSHAHPTCHADRALIRPAQLEAAGAAAPEQLGRAGWLARPKPGAKRPRLQV